jgi:hypothetical protein
MSPEEVPRAGDAESQGGSFGQVDGGDPSVVAALRGENPMVMARMPSGFAVIGDTQHLPGYSLLLCGDQSVEPLD